MPMLEPYGAARPCTEHRKRTLNVISRGLEEDRRRTGASIALLQSGQMRIARHQKLSSTLSPAVLPAIPLATLRPGPATGSSRPTSGISLEQAFDIHVQNFDKDGDESFGIDELLTLLSRCDMYDDWLTPSKVRAYFLCLWGGSGGALQPRPSAAQPAATENNIRFPEFESMLRWAADLKGVPYSECCYKLVNQSRKICDKTSSQRRRLQVVFETYCKTYTDRMTVFEFAGLCRKLDVYRDARFCNGDVHILFKDHGRDQAVDFEGFMSVLAEITQRVDVGHKLYDIFAVIADNIDADEGMLAKMRLRMKVAAQTAGGRDWEALIRERDFDGSGDINWDEFYTMCRTVLKLTDPDIHLRTVFQKLDYDDSGEISIEEMIDFVQDPAVLAQMGSMSARSMASTGATKPSPRYYSARYQIDMSTNSWAYQSDRPVSSYHQQQRNLTPRKMLL